MKVWGLPWADVREAGRLDRSYREFDREHRRAVGELSAIERWLDVPSLMRWGGVLALLYLSLLSERGSTAKGLLLAGFAAILSLPWLRIYSSARLDYFKALRMPSRGSLVLAQWREMTPALGLAGISWAVFIGWRVRSVAEVPPLALVLLLLAVAALPFRIAAGSAWKKAADRRMNDAGGGLFRWMLLTIVAGRIAQAMASGGERFRLYSLVPAAVALLVLVLWVMELASLLREGRWRSRAGGRAAFRVLGMEAAGILWLLAIGTVCIDPDVLGVEGPPGAAWWIAGLGLVASPVTALGAGFLALRDVGTSEVPGTRLTRQGEIEDADVPDASVRSSDADRRGSSASTASRPLTSPGRPRRGAWAAHIGMERDFHSAGARVLIEILLLLLLAIAVGAGINHPTRLSWLLLIAGLAIPRRIGVAHRERALLMGMDLRDQAIHDLKALAVFGALPAAAICAVVVALWGWSPEMSWGCALLGAVLLFRAGRPGWRCWLVNRALLERKRPDAYTGLLIAIVVGALVHAALGEWESTPAVWTLAFSLLGAWGLVLLLTRTEDDLREEMRVEAEER